MNMIQLGDQLKIALERALGSTAHVFLGPPQKEEIPEQQAAVYVMPAGYQDLGGITLDGAQIGRRPLAGQVPAAGFAEERPGRVIVEVGCLVSDYRQLHELCSVIGVEALRSLESTRAVTLSEAPDDGGYLRFADFQASLHEERFICEPFEQEHPYWARLIFHLDGFLHVQVVR
jgi:hypothetical protein